MNIQSLEIQPKSYARIAGLLYLVIAVFGAFAIGYVPSVIIEAGDAATTANNLLSNMGLFQMGIYVWELFFGMHLVALGYMIVKSDLFPLPRILGWMMLIGSLGYSFQGLANVTHIENAVLGYAIIGLLTIVTIGELAFAFWLLVKGIKTSDQF